jgi:colicin import membrane protein
MQMRTASAISAGLHVAVLLWATLSLTGSSFETTPAESLPIDLVSDKQFSEITRGIKDAPKPVEKPKPLVEKIGEPPPKPVEDLKAKVTEKQEVKLQKEQQPAPAAQPTPDSIADKIKTAEKQEVDAEQKPLPPKKPPPPKQPKFDADKIAALLDKRDPQRTAATGETLSVPSFGATMGNAARLSQSELDALRARLMGLWNPPVGIKNPEAYLIRIRIRLGRDGRLSSPPMLLTSGRDQIYEAAAASALRAVFQGQPFDMLKPEHYEMWKDIEVTFDPRDMFRG